MEIDIRHLGSWARSESSARLACRRPLAIFWCLFFSMPGARRAIAPWFSVVSNPTSPSASYAPPCVVESQSDQSQWFADEVHVHESQLKSFLRGSFPAVRDVDDVVQESYLRIWKARAAQPIDSARAFLF